MNEQIDKLVDEIYIYAKDGKGEKKLVDYVDEVHNLVKREQVKAVRKFVKHCLFHEIDGVKYESSWLEMSNEEFRKIANEFVSKIE